MHACVRVCVTGEMKADQHRVDSSHPLFCTCLFALPLFFAPPLNICLRCTARLGHSHPNLVPAFAVCVDESGPPIVVMELMCAGDLKRYAAPVMSLFSPARPCITLHKCLAMHRHCSKFKRGRKRGRKRG